MSDLKAHFVFGTTASFSHVGPVINLALALLDQTPDLCISVILHINNVPVSEKLIAAHPNPKLNERLKLHPGGEKTGWKDSTKGYMQLVNASGGLYAGILANHAPWPAPTVFIFDITSFYYPQVKAAVEANFPHIKPARLVGYNPQPASYLLFLGGSLENGSLRWVNSALLEYDPNVMSKPDMNQIKAGTVDASSIIPKEELQARMGKAYREVVTDSDRIVNLPGSPPFHLYEQWAKAMDWTQPAEFGWFQFLTGYQDTALMPEAWVCNFPNSVVESACQAALESDKVLFGEGAAKKPFFETGWFENKPDNEHWGEGVREFLDSKKPKEVVYISFGTIVDAGEGFPVLFQYLKDQKLPFLYAGGSQKDSLPEDIQALLLQAEQDGWGLAPNWVNQINVLSHPSILCYISHCGANSFVEAILSATPVITWGRNWDQITLGTLIAELGVGVELVQQRSGHSVGREVAHRRVIVEGTPEALRKEIEDAFAALRKEGGAMIGRAEEFGAEIRKRREGIWTDAVARLGMFGRD
ncbi:hypothetical protein P7C73_g2080, partial [Tremellales sp. Uapishka_1]